MAVPILIFSSPVWYQAFSIIQEFPPQPVHQQCQRFLSAKVTGFRRNHCGDSFLHDVHFSAAKYLPERNSGLHFAGQIQVIEAVGVADALIRNQLKTYAAKRVAATGGEIRERHLVAATDVRIELVNFASESMRWQPFSIASASRNAR